MSFKWALRAAFCFIDVHNRKHLFTKVCRPKHAQNFCHKGCHFGVACIGIARGQGSHSPLNFYNAVILCLDSERRFSKQNSVICLRSNILPPPNFWAGYTIISLEKDTDRMCPSSPRQTWSSNLNHTASQLFQVASPRAHQRCLMWMAKKRLGSPSQVGQKSVTAAWRTPTTILLSYLCIESSQCLVPWYAYFLDKGNEQYHHWKVVSSTRTTST